MYFSWLDLNGRSYINFYFTLNTMNEIQLTRKIKIMIEKEFPGTYVQRVSDKFLCGIPDLRVVCYGLSGDLEIKLPGKGKKSEPDPIQKKVLEWIEASGGYTGVAKTVEEARLWMQKLYKKGRVHHESCLCQNP